MLANIQIIQFRPRDGNLLSGTWAGGLNQTLRQKGERVPPL